MKDPFAGAVLMDLAELDRHQREHPEAFQGPDTLVEYDHPKGHISTSKTVWCGACMEWSQYEEPTDKKAARRARRDGWTLTREWGWLCPDCSAKGANDR